jgi:lysyl-tRNA synthetase class 2
LRVAESIARHFEIDEGSLSDRRVLEALAKRYGLDTQGMSDGKLLMEVFDASVQPTLIQPTFITHYPAAISPLSRRNDADPTVVDRFELFINGTELANAFSELNDPVDQYGRFEAQLRARAEGDVEAHPMDTDYVRALEYGMPPAAGQGIGIDRLVMLLSDSQSIRDVIAFPLMRPEAGPARSEESSDVS